MKPFNLDEYLKNHNRKIVTRDERKVTIYCTNLGKSQPIVAQIEGAEFSQTFTKDGKFSFWQDTQDDLFFVTEKHEGWVNIYEYGRGKYITSEIVYTNKEDAIMGKNKNYLTTIKIEWEE